MGDIITLAFNRKSVISSEQLQAQLQLLTERVFDEYYKGDIGNFVFDLQHECKTLEPVKYKEWLQAKLNAKVVQRPLYQQ